MMIKHLEWKEETSLQEMKIHILLSFSILYQKNLLKEWIEFNLLAAVHIFENYEFSFAKKLTQISSENLTCYQEHSYKLFQYLIQHKKWISFNTCNVTSPHITMQSRTFWDTLCVKNPTSLRCESGNFFKCLFKLKTVFYYKTQKKRIVNTFFN